MFNQRTTILKNKPFVIRCGGCQRTFYSNINFEQHFWCPWRKNHIVQDAWQKKCIFSIGTKTFYYPEDIARRLNSLSLRKDYSYEWDALLRNISSLTQHERHNIWYFCDNFTRLFIKT